MYQAHRERFLAELAPRRAAALVCAAPHKIRNHDAEFRYRQDSDFWYLTGFGEPESALLCLPPSDPASRARTILFLRDKQRDEEIWSGRRLGLAAAPGALGVDQVFPIAELWTKLPDLLKGYARLVYKTGQDEARDRNVLAALAKLRAQPRLLAPTPLELCDPAPLLHELRLCKDAEELARMRRAAAITTEAHLAAMAGARAGMNEAEIDALLTYTFLRRGASGCAYTNIVAGGANACILHYVENNQTLTDGRLLLVDAGSEVECYASDVTRTFPIGGTFTSDQRALYEVVLEAQLKALAEVQPGRSFQAAHDVAVRTLTEGLVRLGLLAGPVEEALAKETYKRFYMHRTGHWLGLDVHDCGAYTLEGAFRTLTPGMVVTVEPGLYVPEDDETVEPRWRGIGIRIEDDVLVTPRGQEILTAAIPKSVRDVEAACARDALLT